METAKQKNEEDKSQHEKNGFNESFLLTACFHIENTEIDPFFREAKMNMYVYCRPKKRYLNNTCTIRKERIQILYLVKNTYVRLVQLYVSAHSLVIHVCFFVGFHYIICRNTSKFIIWPEKNFLFTSDPNDFRFQIFFYCSLNTLKSRGNILNILMLMFLNVVCISNADMKNYANLTKNF